MRKMGGESVVIMDSAKNKMNWTEGNKRRCESAAFSIYQLRKAMLQKKWAIFTSMVNMMTYKLKMSRGKIHIKYWNYQKIILLLTKPFAVVRIVKCQTRHWPRLFQNVHPWSFKRKFLYASVLTQLYVNNLFLDWCMEQIIFWWCFPVLHEVWEIK